MKKLFFSLGVLIALFSSTSVMANSEFPGRAEYPQVALYQKEDLLKDFNKVVVVDARSSLEFETLRIKGALNISIASKDFPQKIKELRKSTKRPIVFYCNGRTCFKSYKAVRTAQRHGVKNVFAYDAGVFEWAKTYPKYAELLGTSPMDPAQIISKAKLKERFISPKEFTETVRNLPRSKSLVLDVRDKYQRAGVGFFIGLEKWVSLDDEKKLAKYLQKAIDENRTLYIYDEAGKQVRWLQYTLEQYNVKNYYFMTKGAKQFYKDMI